LPRQAQLSDKFALLRSMAHTGGGPPSGSLQLLSGDPDAIKGGTWEALALLLHSYYPTGLPKVEVARTVSALMVPERNRSHSFQVFWQGLLTLVGQ
jgi:hypothetical protein